MRSLIETGCPCIAVCLCPSHLICSHTLFQMCTCISTWIYVHLTVLIWSSPMRSLIETGCPCIAVCLCPSHLISDPTPCLECVHASVHVIMCTWLPRSGPDPMHSLMETGCPLYGSVFVSQSPHFCSHTLFRMCTCISTWIYVHLTVLIWSSPMHSLMANSWYPCIAVCLCPSHLISVPTPCLECVHASVHEFMSTWLPISAPPCMHSLMEICVPLYGSVFVSQSPHFCSHTFFPMCTCISTWIYVHLTVHVCYPPLCIVSWKPGCPYVLLCVCPIHIACVPTLCLECVHASVHEFCPPNSPCMVQL